MIVDAELLNGGGASIHQSKTMFLAAGEVELCQSGIVHTRSGGAVADSIATVKAHFAIDQIVVGRRSHFSQVRPHDIFQDIIVVSVVVVVQGDRANIDIVLMGVRTVYHQRTPEPSGILAGVV